MIFWLSRLILLCSISTRLAERFLDQFLHRADLLGFGNLDVIQRHNVDVVQPGVLGDVAAERVLEHDFLLLDIGLRDQQVFLAAGNPGRRAGHFNPRHGPDLDLFLVAFVKLLRRSPAPAV